VLLMDEPLSNLDALLRLEMRAELKSVLAEAGTTTIYVTHDQTEAMGLADRIAVMHQGRIVQEAAPAEVYRRPRSMFVGGFVGSPPMNFLRLPIRQGVVRLGSLELRPPAGADGMVVLGVRPEDLAPVVDGFGFRVQVVEPLGSHLLLTGAAEDQKLRVVVPPDTAVRAGDTIALRPDLAHVAWMHPETGEALEPS